MDSTGVRQVPQGNGEQRKMEETGCEVTCGAPTTPTVKGQVKWKTVKCHWKHELLHLSFFDSNFTSDEMGRKDA